MTLDLIKFILIKDHSSSVVINTSEENEVKPIDKINDSKNPTFLIGKLLRWKKFNVEETS